MMSLAFLATVALAAAPVHNFPLAAAFVVDGRVVLVDVPTRTATPLDLDGLLPEEADLSPDKRWVAFDAKRSPTEHLRLFLYDTKEKFLREVTTSEHGEHRFPRFAEMGAWLYFSAAGRDEVGGPANPLRLMRMRMKDGRVEKIPSSDGTCEFSPVGLSKDRVAHISTHCYIGYELALTHVAKHETSVIGSVGGPRSELAAPFDGERLLFTSETPGGLGFFIWTKGSPAKLLTTVAASALRLQPRFVCPKDVVFYNSRQFWVLDSKSGQIQPLFAFPEPPNTVPFDGGR